MENFGEWYLDILEKADLVDSRYPIKGLSVIRPYGFQIRKQALKIYRDLVEKEHEELLFPTLIPESELAKEGEHVKGFEDEVYWITHGGKTPLNEKLALRPTSESVMYPMFSLWVRSHIDLPMKYFQVVNTFRYETKHTRPIIRVREIQTFAEAHTIHAYKEEAEEQIQTGIQIFKELFDSMGIPYTISKRPEWDTFPGAEYTMAMDVLMPSGRTLQIGTVHNLGQTFSKTYDIIFENKEGEHEHAYQTCYGISGRILAALFGIHGDEKGLKLPPKIAPNQITLIPILFKKGREEVLNKCKEIKEQLEKSNIRVNTDDREIRPGKKFFDWEIKGTPLRLELGPRDLENNKVIIVRRDTVEKTELPLDDNLTDNIQKILNDITENLRNTAWETQKNHIKNADKIEEINQLIKEKNMVTFDWCGEKECGKQIEEKTDIDLLGTLEENNDEQTTCIHCGKPAKHKALIAKSY